MGKKERRKEKEEDKRLSHLRRKTLNVKYAQQLPFRKIVRKTSGKSLVDAQRLWRDGTALFDRLGLPVTFQINEVPKLLEGASLKEKTDIFNLCGQAILREQKSPDPDITDLVLLNALFTTGPECESYYADIVYAFCNQFFYLNNMYKNKTKLVENIQNAFKRAIGKSSDPRIFAMQGNFLAIYETPRAIEQKNPYAQTISCLKLTIESFEHKLKSFKPEFDEGSSKFEVYYTLATVLNKKLNIIMTNKKHLRVITPEAINQILQDYKLCLELFLKKAPKCHWSVPSASFMLSTEWLRRKTPPTGAVLVEILKRNVSDVERSIKLFDEGIESCKTLVKWNPNENLQDKPEYKEALKLQQLFKEEKYREDEIPAIPISVVEMREVLDEDNLTWSEWFKWNLTDPRNFQLFYLFILFGLLIDPIFNIFGFFVNK